MATYGFPVPGQINFTGYSNTLGSGPANQASTAGYVYYNGLSQGDGRIAMMLRNGGMGRNFKAIWAALTGAAPGAAASSQKLQVQWQQGSPGGWIPIETILLTNRTTTAGDVTAFQALIARMPFPSSYPADLSGNGGGGKQQVAGGAF
ncbi:MAG TPA: hypothetical protein VGN34_02850 [Ktedonobacteraceae bacterium]